MATEPDGATEPLDGDFLPFRSSPEDRARNRLGGRPRLYDSPEQFDEAVEAYYLWCMGYRGNDKNGEPKERALPEPMTITGLTLFMGFAGVQSLYDYGTYPEFSESVQRARTLISYGYELKLHGPNSAGAKFALRCIDGGEYWNEPVPGAQVGHAPEDRLAHLK